tara:strand:- start:537 stop:761 length:225 start_codon:yes stop_codon:yes gene_type:complete
MELVLILVIALAVAYKLGLFGPIIDLSDVASRESSAYNREHKVKVAKRYESMTDEFDAEKVNANIAKVDSLKFD